MTFSAISTPSSESYLIPSCTSISENPITPRPIRLVFRLIAAISGIGYLLRSITLSSIRTVVTIVRCSRSQSTSAVSSSGYRTIRARFTDAKLQDS